MASRLSTGEKVALVAAGAAAASLAFLALEHRRQHPGLALLALFVLPIVPP